MKQPKVALFYDWLNQWGGAEKVLLDLIKIFPDAPVYTLVYDPKKTNWLPKSVKVIPSSLNNFPFSKKNPIFYTPFYSHFLERFDFSSFDILISTTQVSGYYLLTQPKTLFICYLHNVNRYIYQTPSRFQILKPLLKQYKKFDFIYSQRPDYLFCNSKNVQKRIKDAYCREAEVINPGVDTSFFTPSLQTKNEYFLVVSRLVLHKKIDIAIEACHKLNLKLKIVGTGREEKNLQSLINRLNDPNIELIGGVSDQKLLKLYQNCLALICPQEEDFGLTPIEAQACGKPIIAFRKGGLTETVIDLKTGIFFDQQTTDALIGALKKFSQIKFSAADCVKNSLRFSRSNFMLNFKQTVEKLWQTHQKKITTY